MVNQENIKSTALKNTNIYFESIFFQNIGISEKEKNVEIGFKEIHKLIDNKIAVKLFCKVEKKDNFYLNLCLVGNFIVGDEYPTNKILPNAIAIMFPYLRTQVTIMTAQPGINPVMIPAININEFLKKQESELNKI